jgi:general stress protein 26
MKTETQNTPELIQLAKLLADQSVAMLTTPESDGTLISRPMAALEMDAQGAIWFFTDLFSSKVDQLAKVNLSFADPANSCYVSMAGRSEVVVDHARNERLWTAFARPWFPDGPDSANLALLKFVPDSAEYWDAKHSKMIRMFAVAASIVAAKPIGMGDHDTLTGLSKPAASLAP